MRFGIKGIFQIETHFSETNRYIEKLYEFRVININAETEAEACNRALEIFGEDEWNAVQPTSDIKYQEQKFLGVSQIRDLGPSMELYEVWYEYTDECPKISVKPKPA